MIPPPMFALWFRAEGVRFGLKVYVLDLDLGLRMYASGLECWGLGSRVKG